MFCWCLNKLDKQTDLKGQHNFRLFCFGYTWRWRTLPPFLRHTVFWGTSCPLRTACLFTYGRNAYFWLCIIASLILRIFKIQVRVSLSIQKNILSGPLSVHPEFLAVDGISSGSPSRTEVKSPNRGNLVLLTHNIPYLTIFVTLSIFTTNATFFSIVLCQSVCIE